MFPVQTLVSRSILFAWLIIWISSVPLYHLHIPDSTDRWSELHSGGAHTILSPDLEGEFSRESQTATPHVSRRIVNSPEFGLVMLEEESKAQKLDIFASECHLLGNVVLPRSVVSCLEERRTISPFYAINAPRSPPRPV